ncbi:MAG: DUF3109 family protein [Bacteroidales bacterium]
MVLIGEALVSLDVFEQRFICDIQQCKGNCCVEGVAGAPVEDTEGILLESILEKVKPYMRKEGLKAVKKHGAVVKDNDGDMVTPLVRGEECAYAVFEDGIAKCAIENAYFDGKINFRKPISCHLYPIRISDVGGLEALNYHEWEICRAAVNKGNIEGVPVYKFLKEALVRRYGKKWYKELEETANAYYAKQQKGN